MKVHFFSGSYLKSWPNWTGVIPQTGDTVLLHSGDHNEQEGKYKVVNRVISGTEPDSVIIHLEWIDKEDVQ